MASSDPPHLMHFKGIAASVVKACVRASQAALTGTKLRQAAIIARTLPRATSSQHEGLRSQLAEVGDDQLEELGRELQRSTLITAIGILDFCLFETLVFMIGTHPQVKAKLPKDVAKGSLNRTSIERRIALINDLLGITVNQALVDELRPLLKKRHAIVHESKFYAMVPLGETMVAEAQPFPEVSYYESMETMMTITEIADSVLVGVAREFFQADLGLLRPLNPAVTEFNKSMRRRIQEDRGRGAVVEVIDNAEWEVLTLSGGVAAIDKARTVAFSVTSLNNLPVAVFCLKHDVHGEKAYMTIDDNEKEEISLLMKPEFLAKLLAGKWVLVEYHSKAAEAPLFVRLSLRGFSERWAQAVVSKVAQGAK